MKFIQKLYEKDRSTFVGILSGSLYLLILYLIMNLCEPLNEIERIMTLGFVFVTPIVTGALTVHFGTPGQLNKRLFVICAPWIPIVTTSVILLLIQVETVICIVMLLPAFLICASIGGLLVRYFKKKSSNTTLLLCTILPIISSISEGQFENPKQTNTISTEVIIKSDKETVWNTIKSVDNIRDNELQWSFAHFIGLPKPIKSQMIGENIGTVRTIFWDKGIRFKEVIKEIKKNEYFYYDIIIDTIPPDAFDKHIKVGGEHFSIKEGGYTLTSIDDHTTKLTLSCTYTVSTKFNFYSKFWADKILDDFQVVILNVIKPRCEKKYGVQ